MPDLFDDAIIYLESKGMFYADPLFYLPSVGNTNYAAISVSSDRDDNLLICVEQPWSGNDDVSTTIALNSSQWYLLESILDTLIFAIKYGSDTSTQA